MFDLFGWLRRPQTKSAATPLAGMPLHYLIGTSEPGQGVDGIVTEVPYGDPPVHRGRSIGYCNTFDELNTGQYGPYVEKPSDTAREYQEGQIVAGSQGWVRNLDEQFAQRQKQGFEFIELDNCDAYEIRYVIDAIERAAAYGLKVIAKNPGLFDRLARVAYVTHPNVFGIIVEKNAGTPAEMDALREACGKPDLPVWFVAFGDGMPWAKSVARSASGFKNMGVTYSTQGEYGDAVGLY